MHTNPTTTIIMFPIIMEVSMNMSQEDLLICPVNRLDTDPNSGLCRLAFHGRVLWMASNKEREKVAGELVQLKVAKDKQKQGVVERASNSQEVNRFMKK